MAWVIPHHSKSRVDAAGRILTRSDVSPSDVDDALQVLNNWRSSHSYPLNTFQMRLRHITRQIDPDAIVAQRLKRVPSIVLKLERFPKMALSRMQDIGGCRAVLPTVREVEELYENYEKSRLRHTLVNVKNYIENPKNSGYRGIHLVYRYKSRSIRREDYNGLLIELQFRSKIQHAWATAVETVGTFLEQSLKASEGPGKWLRFFANVSAGFALIEDSPSIPDIPSDQKTIGERVARAARALDVEQRLSTYGLALNVTSSPKMKGSELFLLNLRPAESTLSVVGYPRAALVEATNHYLELEKEATGHPGAEVVLVSVDSIDALRRSYPNYFLDTGMFIQLMDQVVAWA